MIQCIIVLLARRPLSNDDTPEYCWAKIWPKPNITTDNLFNANLCTVCRRTMVAGAAIAAYCRYSSFSVCTNEE